MAAEPPIPQIPHAYIDNRWVPCLPAEDFGFLGDRYVCDLGGTRNNAQKKLLLRKFSWHQEGIAPCELLPLNASNAQLPVRPMVAKSYRMAFPLGNGKFAKDNHRLLQQDITDHIALRRAVLSLAAEGKYGDVWRLFRTACAGLRKDGIALAEAGKKIPLQTPPSLAVNLSTHEIAALDGELKIPSLSADNDRAFHKWFGDVRIAASAEAASSLHAKALLAFFREFLGHFVADKVGTNTALALAKVAGSLDDLASKDMNLESLAGAIGEQEEDWSLKVDDAVATDEKSIVAGELKQAKVRVSPEPLDAPAGSRVVCRSMRAGVCGVFLALAVWGAWALISWLFGLGTAQLRYSHFLVVVPVPGAPTDKVQDILVASFHRDRVIQVDDVESAKQKQLGVIVQRLSGAAKRYEEILVTLQKHDIRFKGHVVGDAKNLERIFTNGGVFSVLYPGGKTEMHFVTNDIHLAEAIRKARLSDRDRAELLTMRDAVDEYQSLRDALAILGNRAGFLLKVEPTESAHRKATHTLVQIGLAPAFASRPLVSTFDAIDSATGSGGGAARYVLQLDRPWFWRQVSSDRRQNIDYSNNPTNARMRWQQLKANARIEWTPIGVLQRSGRTEQIASFDVAVALEKKVVVFRNQDILQGESAGEIRNQVKKYVETTLGLNSKEYDMELLVNIQPRDENLHSGAIVYSYLASFIKESIGNEVEVLEPSKFDVTRQKEDSKVGN